MTEQPKDYDSLSDYEVNKRIAEIRSEKKIGYFDDGNWCKDPDYCDDPKYAWPIILENRIDLEWNPDDCCAAKYYGERTPMKEDIHYHNENPLRAAMIVYLKMKDTE